MDIDFSKMHGLGNDFIVIDGVRQVLPPSLTTPASIAHIADRRLGVGCDQVLILEADDEADFLYPRIQRRRWRSRTMRQRSAVCARLSPPSRANSTIQTVPENLDDAAANRAAFRINGAGLSAARPI